nr:4'-phosphopantetheinyl transferase superfamily protein [Murinocardiopsis flavida]
MWWADPSWAGPRLLALLDDSERARRARFQRAADRDRYTVAHALARVACAHAAGCAPEEVGFAHRCRSCERRGERDREPHGKPHPAGPAAGLEMSLSHSGDRVVLALTRGAAVGVDVEQVTGARDVDGLAKYALAGGEHADWRALPAPVRTAGFFTYWARKEALLKATGDGLSEGLTVVQVGPPHEPAVVRSWRTPEAPGAVYLTDLDAGADYRAALAVLAPGEVRVAHQDAAPLLGVHPR